VSKIPNYQALLVSTEAFEIIPKWQLIMCVFVAF